jgi:hypothetical protein
VLRSYFYLMGADRIGGSSVILGYGLGGAILMSLCPRREIGVSTVTFCSIAEIGDFGLVSIGSLSFGALTGIVALGFTTGS